MNHTPLNGLTARETQILKFIAEGDSLPEIAQKLHRSLKTVESHRLSLGRKLGASNRVELARLAIAAGLVEVAPITGLPAFNQGLQAAEAGERSAEEQHQVWVKQINEAIFDANDTALIQRFCDVTSGLPGVAIAAICTSDPLGSEGADQYFRLVLAHAERGTPGDPMRYHAKHTPCETVMDEGACCFSADIAKTYPKDHWLQAVEAESYIGIQLRTVSGQAVGTVSLIGREPLKDTKAYERILRVFAPRLASALAACNEMNALRERCEQLESVLVDKGITPRALHATSAQQIYIARISRRVDALVGAAFLRGIVDAICEMFVVQSVGICRVDSKGCQHSVSTIILREDAVISDAAQYEAEGTPCADVVHKGFVSMSEGAIQAYPNDKALIDRGLDAYIGIRLPAMPDGVGGILWVLDPGPFRDPDAIEAALRHFAPRIGSELGSFLRLELLMQQQEQSLAERNPSPRRKRRRPKAV